MAYSNSHIIQSGENVQKIALEKLGNINYWMQIVQLNHLDFPYIVNSEHKKAAGIRHRPRPYNWLTYGDRIILPSVGVEDVSSNVDSFQIGHKVYDTTMGMDLQLGFNQEAHAPGANYDDQMAYYTANNKGDLATVSGIRNLLQSLTLRLMTARGALPYHPDYGSNLNDYIGHESEVSSQGEFIQDISNEITRTIESDGRVTGSTVTDCEIHNENFFAVVIVYPVPPLSSFTFYADSVRNGLIETGFLDSDSHEDDSNGSV